MDEAFTEAFLISVSTVARLHSVHFKPFQTLFLLPANCVFANYAVTAPALPQRDSCSRHGSAVADLCPDLSSLSSETNFRVNTLAGMH